MAALARWVSRYFLALLIGAYVLSVLVPAAGRWLCHVSLGEIAITGSPQPVTPPMILLALLLGFAGLEVRYEELRHLLRRPSVLIAGLVANLLVPVLFIACVGQLMRPGDSRTDSRTCWSPWGWSPLCRSPAPRRPGPRRRTETSA